jgi:hypothetical protein
MLKTPNHRSTAMSFIGGEIQTKFPQRAKGRRKEWKTH